MIKDLIKYSILSSLILLSGCVQKQEIKDTNIKTRDKVFVNGKNGVIIDLEKNVAYYVFDEDKMYYDGLKTCENLLVDNISEWHLPSYENLGNIIDMSKKETKTYEIFENIKSKQYWSTKESKISDKFKITIDFKDGADRDDHIFNENGLICSAKIKIK